MAISEITLAELRSERARRDLALARLRADQRVTASPLLRSGMDAEVRQAQERSDDYALIVAWAEAEGSRSDDYSE